MNWKSKFDMLCCRSLTIIKILQKKLRKFTLFMGKVSLLTSNSRTGFQSFVQVISLRNEPRLGRSSDHDQNALRELEECNPRKSSRELKLDFSTPQSTICRYLKKKIGKMNIKMFKENALHSSIGKTMCFSLIIKGNI